MMRKSRAFTLVELMIVIAVVAVLAMLAAPSIRELIEMQRLRGISAQVVTDIQFARSEAARLNRPVGMAFASNNTMTCYMVFAGSRPLPSAEPPCNCLRASGVAPCAGTIDLRTVQVLKSLNVELRLDTGLIRNTEFEFQPEMGVVRLAGTLAELLEGRFYVVEAKRIGGVGILNTQIPGTGRPSVCSPPSGLVRGVAPC